MLHKAGRQAVELYQWFKNRKRTKIISHSDDSPTINIKSNEEEKGKISEDRELNEQSSISSPSKKIILTLMNDQNFMNVNFDDVEVVVSPKPNNLDTSSNANLINPRQNDMGDKSPTTENKSLIQDIKV